MDRATLAHQALKHWTTWLPEKVRALRAEGKLDEAVQGAAAAAQRGMQELVSQGFREHEAAEVVLPQYVLLPPEPEAVDSDEEARELLEMEQEYQRVMRGTV